MPAASRRPPPPVPGAQGPRTRPDGRPGFSFLDGSAFGGSYSGPISRPVHNPLSAWNVGVGVRKPRFGGTVKARSVAGSVLGRPPPGENRTEGIEAKPPRDVDKLIQKLPAALFAIAGTSDPPDLSAICSEDGPGFFEYLNSEDQWTTDVYQVPEKAPRLDFCAKVSGGTTAYFKRLFLTIGDFLSFSLSVGAGEYIPVERKPDRALQTEVWSFRCLTCGYAPVGDHAAHGHHQDKRGFTRRGEALAPIEFRQVIDDLELGIRAFVEYVEDVFADKNGHPAEQMAEFLRRKRAARVEWDDYIRAPPNRRHDLARRPFGSYPVGPIWSAWPFNRTALCDTSALVAPSRTTRKGSWAYHDLSWSAS